MLVFLEHLLELGSCLTFQLEVELFDFVIFHAVLSFILGILLLHVGVFRIDLTITVVYDNDTSDPQLKHGWGFSALVEKGTQSVLFDCGDNGKALLANLRSLQKDPADIDSVAISHGHADHYGGLAAFLAVRPKIDVYLPGGVSRQLVAAVKKAGGHPVLIAQKTDLGGGIALTGPLGGTIAEQSLVVNTDHGPLLVTGCSHPGIEKMIPRVEKMVGKSLYGLVGGLHLMSAGHGRMKRVVEVMRASGLQIIAAGHCTGKSALATLKKAFPKRCVSIGSGKVIRIE